jgi:hypothetical protein
MPVVFRYHGYKFFFYSNEGNPLEPAHIHVRLAGKEAKFWLAPDVMRIPLKVGHHFRFKLGQ